MVGDDALPTGREIRTHGVDVRVEIMRYRKLRLSSDKGRIYELVLIVRPPHGGNFLLQVGNPVPDEAVSLVVPGRELPAKLLERDMRALLIDWAGALAELSDESTLSPPVAVTPATPDRVVAAPDREGPAPAS